MYTTAPGLEETVGRNIKGHRERSHRAGEDSGGGECSPICERLVEREAQRHRLR